MPTNRCKRCGQPLVREETICDKCKGGPALREVKSQAREARTPCQFVLRTVGNLPIRCGLSQRHRTHTPWHRLFHPYDSHQFVPKRDDGDDRN